MRHYLQQLLSHVEGVGNMSSIALLSSEIQEYGHPIFCDPNPDGIYEGHNFETVATKLRSGKGPLRNLMIVWANEHQDLSNFQGTVLSKGILSVRSRFRRFHWQKSQRKSQRQDFSEKGREKGSFLGAYSYSSVIWTLKVSNLQSNKQEKR